MLKNLQKQYHMNMKNQNNQSNERKVHMNKNTNKIIFYILDFIFLMLSYILCDYITDKINLVIGILIGLSSYIIIFYILRKILNIKE